MNLKNYTSNIEASKSMARIEEMLVEIGANNINKQYKGKICTGKTFYYTTYNCNKQPHLFNCLA